MPLPPVPPELKPIVPFLQRADEMRTKDPVISFWCEYYAVKRGLTLKSHGSESRAFLFQLMDSLEATKMLLRDNEAVTNDEIGRLYVENFADRIFVMADEEDRRAATSRSTAKKFLAAGQFFDLLSVFEGATTERTNGPKTSEKRTYAKWRATEISKAFRDNRTPPPPPSPGSGAVSPLPHPSNFIDSNASQSLTASSISLSLREPPPGSSSTPPPSHPTHSRSPTAQSPTTISASIAITSPGTASGNASPGGSGSGTPHRRRASDVSASTPARLAAGLSPAWSTRVQVTPNESANGTKPREPSPSKEQRLRRGLSNFSRRAEYGLNEEDSSTDPGTDEDSAAGSGGVNGTGRKLFNMQENGHEANGENGSNGAGWDVRQASLAVQAPESRQSSFVQRPADVSLPLSPPATIPAQQFIVKQPTSPTSTGSPYANGPPALMSASAHPGSASSSQSSSRQTSPKSVEPAIPQTPGKQTSPTTYSTPGRSPPSTAPPLSVATPGSSHASITPTGSPSESPATTPTTGPTITVSGQPTSLVLPPRRVHFSGSTTGGMSSVASSEASSSPYSSPGHTPTELAIDQMQLQITGPPPTTSPTHSRRLDPTPRAPPAILPPPESPDSILPPLSTALVRPQSYQISRAVGGSNVAYPTASAPHYPEPTYASPPPLVHHHHHHSSSGSGSGSGSQSLVHVPQGTYSYVPATPRAANASPPLPAVISGQSTQRAQKHAKFAISALDYDDLETARKELMNALAIINGRAGM